MKCFAFWVHPKNPNRIFKSISLGTGEVGHTRLECDSISSQARRHYKKKETFSNCEERVNYLNNSTDLEVIQITNFKKLPEIFEVIFFSVFLTWLGS